MSTQQNKTIVLRSYELLDQHNAEGVAQLFAPDFKIHGFGPKPLDAEAWKRDIGTFFAGFPDARFIVDDVIAEGDKVVVRHRFEGTHTAEFQGIPATGGWTSPDEMCIYGKK